MPEIVFDRKNGHIGRRRPATEKELKALGTNYMVEILDPINMSRIEKVVEGWGGGEYDWATLPRNDPRTQFVMLFDIIEDRKIAHWFFSGFPEGYDVEEAYIENRHEIFEKIRDIFK